MASTTDLLEVEKFKVTDLKKELKARGLSTLGVKSELIERLQQAMHTVSTEIIDDDVNEDEMLGVDEVLSEPEKAVELLISEDVILSPEQKPSTAGVKTVEKENAVQQNNGISSPVKSEEKFAKIIFPTSVKILTPKERMELRAKKFNVPVTEDAKKEARAQRFGIAAKSGNITTSLIKPGNDLEKLKLRANRFGTNSSSSLKKVEETDRLQKRKERFGAVVGSANLTGDTEAKKQKRAERFGVK